MQGEGLQGKGFLLSTIPFGSDPLLSDVRTVQPAAYWEEVGLSDRRHHALLPGPAGDDWSLGGIPSVGPTKMITFLLDNPDVTSPKQVRLSLSYF